MSAAIRDRPDRRPRIGVTACFMHAEPDRPIFTGKTLLYAEQSMMRWVQSGGALAYLVPDVGDAVDRATDTAIADYVSDLDGLLLEGGADVCPRSYGEEPLRPEWEGDIVRDRYEIALIRGFLAAGKPVLGICRGAQILNVAFGGTLHQDIGTHVDEALVHRDAERYDRNLHDISVVPGTGLATLAAGHERVTVNSVHHQSVKEVAPGLRVEARSTHDGVVEAIRWDDTDGYAFAVQWHPEFMFDADLIETIATETGPDEPPLLNNRPILDEFLDRARAVAEGAARPDCQRPVPVERGAG